LAQELIKMANDQIARVSYFERQFLRTQDFVDEQAYLIAMRRRHNIAHHRWGIVEGLEIVEEEGSLFVEPGMAVDGYGRELVLPYRLSLPLSAFIDKGSSVLNVWLLYDRVTSGSVQRDICGADGTPLNNRWEETPKLLLEVPDPDPLNPRAPESVPPGDIEFSPTRTPPDDPQQDWPVFLGRVTRTTANQSGADRNQSAASAVTGTAKKQEQANYTIERDHRPYIGLVGESISTPSGTTLVQLGLEDTARRFAVFINGAPKQTTSSSDKKVSPDFAINSDGQIELHGDTTLHGNLTLAQGGLAFKAIELPVGTARAPWHIYRASVRDADGNLEKEQLRVEIEESSAINEFAIGYWSEEDKKFHECLTVGQDCTVTIHGNLVVEKLIKERIEKKKSVREAAESTKQFLLSSKFAGIGAAPAFLQLFNLARLTSAVTPSSPFELAEPLLMINVRESLKSDPQRLEAFVKVLAADGETATMMKTALAEKQSGDDDGG